MSELINFRDFGGYPTKDGRQVKRNIFFRSGSYRDLTQQDREHIQSLNIKNIHDFRESNEYDPIENHQELASSVHLISASEYLGGFDQSESKVTVLTSASMIEFYQLIPFGNPAYKNVFKVLQEDDAVPYLHNCTAGKDRTGLATALIQLALGVNWDYVMLDYMKSMNAYESIFLNEVRRLKNGHKSSDLLHKMPGIVVMPSYLEASFDAIFERYGSLEKYYLEEFGLSERDLEELRDKYTEKSTTPE